MKSNLPIASLPTDQKELVLNIYRYRGHIVGVIERTSLLQLFELTEFLKPAEYIAWRFRLFWPSPLLNVHGAPLTDKRLLEQLTTISTQYRVPIYGLHQPVKRERHG